MLIILDTLEDFYNSPYPVGSQFIYETGPRVNELGSSYGSYFNDIEGAYAKMENGTFSLLESRLSLRYLMRSRYTNK